MKMAIYKLGSLFLATLTFSSNYSFKKLHEKTYVPGLDFINISVEVENKDTTDSHECDGGGPGSGMGKGN